MGVRRRLAYGGVLINAIVLKLVDGHRTGGRRPVAAERLYGS
jgi:hypothetical protein